MIWDNCSHANPIEVNEVSLTYRSFFSGAVDPLITENAYLPGHSLDKELNLQLNSSLLTYLFWNNTIHSMTDASPSATGQFRMVGWEFNFGFDISKVNRSLPLSISYYHYSRHVLDTESSLGHFPVADGIEVKLWLLKN